MINTFGLAISLLLLAAAPLAARPFHHPGGEWREYNSDWLAACPDVINEDATDFYGVSCFASTGSEELNSANLPAYKLTLLRNRLTGDIDIAFIVAAENVLADQSRPLVVKFGGEPAQSFDFSDDLEIRYNTINQFYVSDPVRKAALLEQIKSRNAMTLTVPVTGTEAITRDVRLSLRGANASLDFMASYARKVAQY